jgi:hypothetical protein
MRVFGVAAVTALIGMMALAAPARAQMGGDGGPHVNLLSDTSPTKTPEQIEADQAREKAYKDSLRKIPDAKPNDPWGNVRSDAPKAAPAKSTAAKAKAKTGSNIPN